MLHSEIGAGKPAAKRADYFPATRDAGWRGCQVMNVEALKLEIMETAARAEQGRTHIRQQMDRVARLERSEHVPTQAKELLATFIESQWLHEEHLQRLQQELTSLLRSR